LEKISSPPHLHLFIGLLNMDDADPLRQETMFQILKPDSKLPLELTTLDFQRILLHRHSVLIIHTLAEHDPAWLGSNIDLVVRLHRMWKSDIAIRRYPEKASYAWPNWNNGTKPLAEANDFGTIPNNRHSQSMYRIMMITCDQLPQNVDWLFEIVNGFSDPDLIDSGFIKVFLFEKVILGYDATLRRQLFERFLQVATHDITYERRSYLLRYLLIPLLMYKKCEPSEVITPQILEMFIRNVWNPLSETSGTSSGDYDGYVLNLLQLTTLLMQLLPDLVNEFRKDIIKFAWALLKSEDITMKQSAYVLLSRFIREYETPPKIVLQIYVAQLRAYSPEGKMLVQQALDIMIPGLPFRSGMGNAQDGLNIPVWIQWIRKVLIEDGHNVAQLVAIYQLIIRNSSLFYSCRYIKSYSREHFLLNIVSSIAKLGLSGNTSSDNRLLTIDLGELLLKWDKQEREEAAENGMKIDDTHDTVNYKEMAINYMIRFCLTLIDPQSSKSMIPRALDILKQFITAWPEASVKLRQLESNAASNFEADASNFNSSYIAAEVLKITVETKSDEWICEHLASINKCIARFELVNGSWISSEHPGMISIISTCVAKIYRVLDEVQEDKLAANDKLHFTRAVDTIISHGLRSMSNINGLNYLTIGVKHYLGAAYLNRIDTHNAALYLRAHTGDLVKLFQNLVSEAAMNAAQTANESSIDLIKTLLPLLNTQILYLGELRKNFIQSLMAILEFQGYGEIHKMVLTMLRKWIFDESSFPTMKEKANLAVKMMVFEKHGNTSLFEQFLTLVADVYECENFHRTELTVRLESAFLLGTTLDNHKLRERFCTLLDKSIPTSPAVRLKYIFGIRY
jgi:transformation/transcription domain-associated protein